MDWILLLAIVTFLLVLAFLAWNGLSLKRHKQPGEASGVGGYSDPMSGTTRGMRDPDEMRAALNVASQRSGNWL
jgi:hypothetical protein